MFLRGYGNQSHVQWNGEDEGWTSTCHASGELGQIQGDAARRIYAGSIGMLFMSQPFLRDGASLSTNENKTTAFKANSDFSDDDLRSALIRFDSARITPVSGENRPVNKAVKYIVRTR